MLHAAGLLDDATLAAMLDALERLRADVESGAFTPDDGDEDVHSALERGLIERAGADVGGRLRAGRSRNDQVATLFRMYLREHARVVAGLVLDVVDALVDQADPAPRRRHAGPHPPPARPAGAARRTTCSPTPGRCCATSTGCATGTCGPPCRPTARARWPVPRSGLDPEAVAADLGFDGSVENSIDGTASRDFVAEFSFVAAMTAVDVSRLAEEVVLWATKEFSFVTLDDAYSTGSSIMPQKKNPDVAELARGKAGRLVGDLAGLLTTLKGAAARLQPRPAGGQGAGLRRRRHPRGAAARLQRHGRHAWSSTPSGWSRWRRRASRWPPTSPSGWCAQGVPFRVAHEVAGACVRECEGRGIELWDLSDDDLAAVSPHLTPAVREVLSVEGSLASRSARGGTAPVRVGEQLDRAVATASGHRAWSQGPADGSLSGGEHTGARASRRAAPAGVLRP